MQENDVPMEENKGDNQQTDVKNSYISGTLTDNQKAIDENWWLKRMDNWEGL